jgi:hypothetical protein
MSSSAVKRKLSSSVDGKAIKIISTATPGTLIHTAVSGTVTGTYDEIWLWAYNGYTSDVTLTVEFGGTSVPDQNIITTIPYKSGLIPIVPGFLLQNEMVVSAFTTTASGVVTIYGFVNAITD